MKSLTIHNIDEPLLALLKNTAGKKGKSLNQTVKEMLEREAGMKLDRECPHRAEFEDLCGAWRTEDLSAFSEAVHDFEKVDKEDWK